MKVVSNIKNIHVVVYSVKDTLTTNNNNQSKDKGR